MNNKDWYEPEVEDRTLFADRGSSYVSGAYSRAMSYNNPRNEPVGNYTGRCCGSKDLWDDNLAYGCNTCGAFLGN